LFSSVEDATTHKSPARPLLLACALKLQLNPIQSFQKQEGKKHEELEELLVVFANKSVFIQTEEAAADGKQQPIASAIAKIPRSKSPTLLIAQHASLPKTSSAARELVPCEKIRNTMLRASELAQNAKDDGRSRKRAKGSRVETRQSNRLIEGYQNNSKPSVEKEAKGRVLLPFVVVVLLLLELFFPHIITITIIFII
jgi:hypothetical protein